jgi:hypothetical protein
MAVTTVYVFPDHPLQPVHENSVSSIKKRFAWIRKNNIIT